jgi:cytochrome c-type biogenesis protein CcmH
MSFWFILGLMTLAAMFAVLWPLGRRPAGGAGSDLAVYRDQLDELERDRAAELIGPAEAEAARVEIGRRLIAAADANGAAQSSTADAGQTGRRIAAVLALTVLPIGALALYGKLGSPTLPGAPLAERVQAPALAERSIEELIARVEAHLDVNPEDGRGWEVLAPVYMRLGRSEDAVKARRSALRLLGATATREADLGEALVYAANGVVTEEARQAFERALALDGRHVKARYFLGLAAEQDGKREQAAAIWRALLAEAPAGAPWIETVREALARVDPSVAGTPAGPSAEDMAAAEGLTPEQRATMVRGMVERLAARLKEDGSNLEGWLRLVSAYMVLGEPEKAKAAAAEARTALAGDADKLQRVNELMKTLGLET